MKIRHLKISNFRGIKSLDWFGLGDMVCLVGPGDSMKTTILEAIEYALYPRWNLQLNDLDFYQADARNVIEIYVVISGLPNKLIGDDKFGLHLRFWNPEKGLHDDDDVDNSECALLIHFKVDASLEPEWTVVSATGTEMKLSAIDRELLGVSHISNYVDRDLSWGRGSALTRLTGREDIQKLPAILAEVSRSARSAIQKADLKMLSEAAKRAETTASSFGLSPKRSYSPGLDPLNINVGSGTLTLSDDGIPLRSSGLGSRRLLAMAINRDCSQEGSILLVDEVELGLEPYRLRSLIRQLRPSQNSNCQSIITTHSSVTLVELSVNELYVVRSFEGNTVVINVDSSLQNIIRVIPEAFLAKRVIVCEGKTEEGICRALQDEWERETGKPLACLGVAIISSPTEGGTKSPHYALALAKLGYDVAFLGDSDVPIDPSEEKLREAKVEVVLWADNMEIETRLAMDLPIDGLRELIVLAMDLHDDPNMIWDKVRETIGWKDKNFPKDLDELIKIFDEIHVRKSIGIAAKNGKWFKRIDWGKRLGDLVCKHLPFMAMMDQSPEKDTYTKIHILRTWCYG